MKMKATADVFNHQMTKSIQHSVSATLKSSLYSEIQLTEIQLTLNLIMLELNDIHDWTKLKKKNSPDRLIFSDLNDTVAV